MESTAIVNDAECRMVGSDPFPAASSTNSDAAPHAVDHRLALSSPRLATSSSSYLSELERLPKDRRFIDSAYRLMDTWIARRAGLDAVEGILRFMEAHPEIAYGTPGPLVQFAERFYRQGYEQCLVESIQRHPRAHTVWMLIDLLNRTDDADPQQLVAALTAVSQDTTVDSWLRIQIKEFLAL
jgi:hypothetical protein